MATVLKKKKVKTDVVDVCDVYIHPSDQFAAFLLGRGGLIIEQFSSGEKYALLCPCGEDHVSFRSFCWDRQHTTTKSKWYVRGIGISCDSHGVRLFEFTASRSSSSGSVVADITKNLHSVDCFNCCLQLLDVVGPVVKLLAGKLFLRIRLANDSGKCVVEKESMLTQSVDIGDDVYVERAFVLRNDTCHPTVTDELACATWMSNDELYFWNMDATDPNGFVIAVLNLQSFIFDKVVSLSISDDGTRFCIAYKDGRISVVDRYIFLSENPQRRSRAFRYFTDADRSPSPSVLVNSPVASHSFTASSHPHSTPITVNFKQRPMSVAESSTNDYHSYCNDEKSQLQSSPCRENYVTAIMANSQSCRTSSPLSMGNRSSLIRTRSQSSMTEQHIHTPSKVSLSRTSSKSSLTSEASEGSSTHQKALRSAKSPVSAVGAIQIRPNRSSVFGSVLSMFSEASQSAAALSQSYSVPQFRDKNINQDADCCWFRLPGLTSKDQYHKLVWVGTTLYVWYSTLAAGSSSKHNVIIAVKFSDRKCFAFKCHEPCVPIFFFHRKDPLLLTSQSLQSLSLHEINNLKFSKEMFCQLEMYDIIDIGTALCRLDDWQRSSVPLATFEISLLNGNLDAINSFMTSTKSAFVVQNVEPATYRASPSTLSCLSFDDRSLHSPSFAVGGGHFYNYNDVDRFEAALHAVEQFVKNDTEKCIIEKTDKVLQTVYKFCLDAIQQLSVALDQYLSDSSCRFELIDESKTLLLIVVRNCWNIHNARLLVTDSTSGLAEQVDVNFDPVEKRCFDAVMHYLEIGHVQLAEAFLDSMEPTGARKLYPLYRYCIIYSDVPNRELSTQSRRGHHASGQNVASTMRLISLHTFHRSISRSLVHHLSYNEQDSLDFVCQLESLFSSQDFTAVQTARLNQSSQQLSWLARVDLNDVMAGSHAVNSQQQCGPISSLPKSSFQSESLSYAEILPVWSLHWSEHQKSMILLESILHQSPDDGLPKELSRLQTLDAWNYFCIHLCSEKLMAWIDCQFPLDSERSSNVKNKVTWPSSEPITQQMINILHSCPSRFSNVILDRLARSGVFSGTELSETSCLVMRLSRIVSLMVKPSPLASRPPPKADQRNDPFSTVHKFSRSQVQVHCHVIKYCTEHELVELLWYYMDFWNLTLCPDELFDIGLQDEPLPNWLTMMICFRKVPLSDYDVRPVFDALMATARFLKNESLDERLLLTDQQHAIWSIGALIFRPDILKEIIEERSDKVERALYNYPRLHDALFTKTHAPSESVTVYHLLKIESFVDSSKFFTWQPSNTSATEVEEAVQMPSFTDMSLSSRYCSIEELDFSYYLKLGRPSYAFYAFVIKHCGYEKSCFSPKSAARASRVAYELAVEHHQCVEIVAACVAFVSMLGHDTTGIKLHVQVANHIAQFQTTTGSGETTDIKSLVELCLQNNKASIMQVDCMLVDSISNDINLKKLNRCGFEAGKMWLLSMVFSRYHGLSDCSEFYTECASCDEWLFVLMFGELFQCHPTQLMEICQHFSSTSVKEHTEKAVYNAYMYNNQSPDDCNDAIDIVLSKPKPSLIDRLFRCKQHSGSQQKLLFSLAVATGRCFLAVLGVCYPPLDNVIGGLTAWLVAASPAFKPVAMSSGPEDIDNLADMFIAVVRKLIHCDQICVLLTGFQLFLPECHLIDFLKFCCTFMDTRRVDLDYLHSFVVKANQKCDEMAETVACPHHSSADIIGMLTEHILMASNSFVIEKLLNALDKEKISSLLNKSNAIDFKHLLKLHQVTASAAVQLNYVTLGHTDDSAAYHAEAHSVLERLVSSQHYDIARKFAETANINGDEITINELMNNLTQAQLSLTWLLEETRIAFWKTCRTTFDKHSVSADVATEFFKRQQSENKTRAEQIVLMQLAYDCNTSVTHNEKLDMYIDVWLSRIRHNVVEQSAIDMKQFNRGGLLLPKSSLSKSSRAVELTPPEEQNLQTLLESLLNSGQLMEAERLTHAFGRPNIPVKIVTSCVRLLLEQMSVVDLDVDIRSLSSEFGPHRHTAGDGQMVFMLPHIGLVLGLNNGASADRRLESNDARISAALKLISHCRNGSLCCRYIASLVDIARLTGLSFAGTLTADEFDLLRRLLRTSDRRRFSLAKDFVSISGISDKRLATFVCSVMLESLQTHPEIYPSASREHCEKPILQLPKRLCSVDTRKTSGSIELTQMFSNASVLGHRLVELIRSVDLMMKDTSIKLLTIQVILLTYANDCFMFAASTSGIASILAMVRRVVLKLFETQQYNMVVHLLTSIGQYSDMNYIFDGLKQHDKFDLLFGSSVPNEERFRLALIDFMHRFHPDDTATLEHIAQHFGMHQELAKISEQSANAFLDRLGTSRLTSKFAVPTLRAALEGFIKAAELYAKAKCSFEVLICMSKARLLLLQFRLLKSSSQRVINLTTEEAVAFVKAGSNFSDARVVQEAYELSIVWSDVLFEKVVKNGMLKYVDEMVSVKQLTNDMLNSIFHRYSALKPSELVPSVRANMKCLLEYWTSVTEKYQVAKQLKFDDVVQQMENDEFLSCCLAD